MNILLSVLTLYYLLRKMANRTLVLIYVAAVSLCYNYLFLSDLLFFPAPASTGVVEKRLFEFWDQSSISIQKKQLQEKFLVHVSYVFDDLFFQACILYHFWFKNSVPFESFQNYQLEAVNYYHKELHLGCCSSSNVERVCDIQFFGSSFLRRRPATTAKISMH